MRFLSLSRPSAQFLTIALLIGALTSGHPSASASSLSTSASPPGSSPLLVLATPKITQAFSANRLTASVGKINKKARVSYQWIRDGVPIPGETARTYDWKVPDCPQAVQVRVVISELGKRKVSKLSKPYSPEACFFSTGDLPAWGVLHDCGVRTRSTLPACTEWTFSAPGGFNGFVFRDEKALSWFRVPINGIDPSRVISWRAQAKGLVSSWALSLIMISKNEPSWACCDWKGTKFPPLGSLKSQTSDDVLGLSPDGGAYIGFNYYDKFSLSESLVVQTIEVSVKYR